MHVQVSSLVKVRDLTTFFIQVRNLITYVVKTATRGFGLRISQTGSGGGPAPPAGGSPGIVKQFRGGLVFKAHRLLHHSTLG